MKTNKILTFASLAVAAFAAMSAVGPTQVALADPGGEKGHAFDVTFTKWTTTFPDMAGVVGGDVGDGTFAGEILSLVKSPDGSTTTIHALYHINGSRHFFTADNHITQDNVAGTAVITGVVTEGWLEGAAVTGEYKVLANCPENTTGGRCFQGALEINKNSND
jgi:hypothetical protein